MMQRAHAMAVSKDFSISGSVLLDGRVLAPDHYAFVAHSEHELQKGSYRCQVIEYRAGQWQLLATWPWQAVAIEVVGEAVPLKFEVLGRDGQVGTVVGGVQTETHIDTGRAVGPFRGLRLLHDTLFAYGMKREVYWRDPSGAWIRLAKGFEAPGPNRRMTIAERMKARVGNVGGINAVARDASGYLVAVGMRGEIWRFVVDEWKPIDSPTNLMLKDMVELDDGTLFVCGQLGTLIRSDVDRWETVSYEGPQKLDFCSIGWFSGALYLADGHSLRVLVGDELRLVDHGREDIVPCAVVVASPQRLLSLAGQEVWETADGLRWNCILGG